MKPTVSQALSTRPVIKGEEADFINKELMPIVLALREAANFEGRYRQTVDTDGIGTYAVVWQSADGPTVGVWLLEARVAIASLGGDAATYLLRGTFRFHSGGISQVGTTVVDYTEETGAAMDARLGVSGRQVYVDARDAGAGVSKVTAVVSIAEVIVA